MNADRIPAVLAEEYLVEPLITGGDDDGINLRGVDNRACPCHTRHTDAWRGGLGQEAGKRKSAPPWRTKEWFGGKISRGNLKPGIETPSRLLKK